MLYMMQYPHEYTCVFSVTPHTAEMYIHSLWILDAP